MAKASADPAVADAAAAASEAAPTLPPPGMVAMVKDGEQSDVDLSAVSAHQAVGWTLHHPDVDPAAAPVEGQTRMVKAGRVRHVGVPVSAKHAAVAGVIKAKMEHNATQVALHEADGWAADPKLPAAEA